MEKSQNDVDFAVSELGKKFVDDKKLEALCFEKAKAFLPDGIAAAPMVSDEIVASIRENRPMSLIRVGNGEGNAIQMSKEKKQGSLQVSTFYQEFISQNGIPIAEDEARSLCSEVRDALISADVIGFRAFRFDEREMIKQHIERRNFYAALGILYAREFLHEGLVQGHWRHSTITSAWIHLDIVPYLGAILDAARSVFVITGRTELHEAFHRRLGRRLEAFIAVPVQGFIPPTLKESHFDVFPLIKERLNQNLCGKLVLVGAGLFGKTYCDIAKTNGAVAVDLGSVFDILAGIETRPIHKKYDIEGIRWI
jgi:hypothetical protein